MGDDIIHMGRLRSRTQSTQPGPIQIHQVIDTEGTGAPISAWTGVDRYAVLRRGAEETEGLQAQLHSAGRTAVSQRPTYLSPPPQDQCNVNLNNIHRRRVKGGSLG